MPTDKETASNPTPPKLEVVRLEDRLNPVGVPTTEALLSFNPNPVLDLGVSTPTVPLGTTTEVATIAAPVAPSLAPSLYEQALPAATVSPSSDSSGGSFALFSVVPPPPVASLSGFVYVDEGANGGVRDDGIKQSGEPGIAGATLTLLRVINGVTITASATTTDATGFYQFPNLTPFGEYRVVETQPAGFLDGKDTAGTINGVTRGTAGNEIISGITLNSLDNGVNYNFGELLPVQLGSLSGFVYVDEGANGGTRDDGIKQSGEPGIASTTVTLFRVVNGQTVSVSQTTTDASGFYRFTNLTAGGGYLVRETQPGGFNDGKDTPGSTGGSNATNDELSGITVPVNGESVNNNFGELIPPQFGALSGFVYVDEGANGGTRDDGVKQGGEPGIPGTTVTLFRVVNGTTTSVSQTTTDASGFYRFANLTPGAGYLVRETQPANFNDGKDTPGSTGGTNSANDELSAITVPANGESQNNNFGELVQTGALSGFVYVDEGANGGTRNDGIKQTGEAVIPGTTVTLFRVVNGQTTSLSQTTTDASGFYRFANLTPGAGYLVRETQPANFNDGKDTPGSTGGTNSANDELSAITVPANGESQNNNFGELIPPVPPARLSGFVYEDLDDDGIKDPNEPGIAGVEVSITGILPNGQLYPPAIAVTDANGFYEFTNLPVGQYTVGENQPAAYLDGKDTPGSTGGANSANDVLSAIPLVANANSVNNNFGERRGSISGFVYVDEGANGGTRDDGVKQGGEPGISGVTVRLLRNGVPQATTTTGADGSYRFDGLFLGSGYTVEEVAQPAGFLDGKDTAGTPGGGTAGNEIISNITLTQAAPISPNNNFGELVPPQLGQLSGFVYVDEGANGGTRDDGIKQPGEAVIPGATVTLFRVVSGQTVSVSQTTTDGTGFYQFTGLEAGTYEVRETQPAGFNDGKDTPGSTGGSNAVNDRLTTIPLAAGANSQNNNFGELLQTGALSGFVYVDEGANGGTRDDGIKQPGEAPIAGTTVTLFRVVNGQTTSLSQTTTDASGFYRFANLTPGGGYIVRETQPTGFDDGKDTAGSTGGTVTNDQIAAITVPANGESQNNNFGELVVPPLPARLSGFVYLDEGQFSGGGRDDGIKQSDETGIAGATVTLLRVENGVTTSVAQTVTNGLGFYEFANLPAGTYVVRETQPAGFVDGKDTAGSTGGVVTNDQIATIPLAAGANSQNNNFGELLPPPPARLSGFVYLDAGLLPTFAGRDDGIKQVGETGIAGATVTLLRVENGVTTSVAQTVTNGLGFYEFANLPAGTYVVRETQPAGFVDGKDTAGSTGGVVTNDQIATIPLAAGANSQNNNFGELLPPPPPVSALSGFVYEDTNDNGVKDAGEAGIPGVMVRLFGGTTTTTTTTDATGFYQFTGLTAGQYTVVETQPAAYLDGKDTPGSTGGSSTVNDILSAVNVPAGVTSVNNNFGELKPVSVYGYVWYDANRSATFDTSEIGLGGATVTLTGVTFGGRTVATAVTTTDQSGRYAFTNLLPGVYRVVQTNTPVGYTDYAEQNAASVVVGGSTNLEFAGIPLNRDTGPLNFGKVLTEIVVPPPPPNPQNPLPPSKVNFLGSSGTASLSVQPATSAILPAAAGLTAVGSPAGQVATVRVTDATGTERFTLQPFGGFTGGVTTAVGDVNADGTDDVIVGAMAGGPRVKVYDGRTGAEVADFYAYAPDFGGGVWLASGDVDGDGYDDIVTGTGTGAPHVKVFSGRTMGEIASFYAFDAASTGGVTVVARDVNGDGRADIVAGTGSGQQARVSVFSGATLGLLDTALAFDTSSQGIYVG